VALTLEQPEKAHEGAQVPWRGTRGIKKSPAHECAGRKARVTHTERPGLPQRRTNSMGLATGQISNRLAAQGESSCLLDTIYIDSYFECMEKPSTPEDVGSRETLLAEGREKTNATIAGFKRETEEIENMENPVQGIALATKLLEKINGYVESSEWTSYVALIDYSAGERPSGGMGLQILRRRLDDAISVFKEESRTA
jgi:hypothetical protein